MTAEYLPTMQRRDAAKAKKIAGDQPMKRSLIADLPVTLRRLRLTQWLDSTGRRLTVRRAAPLRLMAAAPALALVVAACSTAAGAPGYSSGPASSPAASSTMNMGPAASTSATPAAPAASGPASTATNPPGGPAAGAAPLHISAQNIQFDTDHLAAPVGRAFVLEFDNNDSGVPHNLEIRDASGASMFKGEIITGPAQVSYQIPALAAGSYTFLCDVHPTMTGIVTVS